MEHAADDEMVCMQAEIQSRIDRVLQEQQKEDKAPEPVKADLAVELSCAEEVEQLLQTKAKISQLRIQSTLTGRGLQSAGLYKPSQFKLSAKFSNGRSPGGGAVLVKSIVKSSLKSLSAGSTTECHVESLVGLSLIHI